MSRGTVGWPPLAGVEPLLVVNAGARSGTRAFEAARRALGTASERAVLTERAAEAVALARREVECGAALVVVGGGDGTLSACATALAGSGTALGVLPLGSGNTFARCLGLPLDLVGAAAVIREGRVEAVDLGRVNGRVFLNSVALGLSARIAEAITPEDKRRFGLLAWPLVGARVGWRQRAVRLRLLTPDFSRELCTRQLVAGNGRYVAGPLGSAPGASIHNGQLEVFALGGSDLASFLRDGLLWLGGRHVHSPTSLYLHTRTLRVESPDGPLAASVDGELLTRTPLEVEVLPRALRVVVPPVYDPRRA